MMPSEIGLETSTAHQSIAPEKLPFLHQKDVDEYDIEQAQHEDQRRRGTRLIVSLVALIALSLIFLFSFTPGCVMGPKQRSSMSRVHGFTKRADSPTDACLRFGQQTAIVNGSLYLYGGATTRSNTFSK